jgi:hypothetical protein
MHNKEVESVLDSLADRPRYDTTARRTDAFYRTVRAVTHRFKSSFCGNAPYRAE